MCGEEGWKDCVGRRGGGGRLGKAGVAEGRDKQVGKKGWDEEVVRIKGLILSILGYVAIVLKASSLHSIPS